MNRAYLLIGATQVVETLEVHAEGDGYVPACEGKALALLGLSELDLQKVAAALEGEREVTRERLKEVVLEVKGSLESTSHLD